MRKRLPLVLTLLLSAPLWTGCAAVPVISEAPRITIPASLQTCPAEPTPPADSANDATLADFVVDLAAAGQACRDNLASVNRIIGK